MTFQQLEYIIAVDKSRHFVNAATACGVTQSTLSSTIQKLEAEIDVIIFDRSKHPIEPTPMGRQVIQQAEIILHNSSMLRQMVKSHREEERGQLRIGMIPDVAQVVFPPFARIVKENNPLVEPHIHALPPAALINMLQRSELDMVIVSAGDILDTNLLSFDLWTERFVLYVSPASVLYNRENLRPEDLQNGEIWVLRDFHDSYPQLTEVIHRETMHTSFLDCGNLPTLISAVDVNGGYTLIPETCAQFLSAEQKSNIRRVNSGKFFRTTVLAIRKDFMREGMLNIVTNAMKRIIPREMLSSRLLNFDKVKI
ncbi:MAG: LysR family transcriptional regulator [Bacteroidales bacterium]|nr:LysR family transcriptional regulator [Bacteroidales bacterium]